MFWVGMVKNDYGQSRHGTQKWADGIKSFFYAGTNLGKLKVESIILVRHGQKFRRCFNSWEPNICCTLRMNLWIELIFWMLIVMQ